LVILDFGVQASEVEPIGKVVFVNFAEVFVAPRRNELCNRLVSAKIDRNLANDGERARNCSSYGLKKVTGKPQLNQFQ
jgi:hypothetical protein